MDLLADAIGCPMQASGMQDMADCQIERPVEQKTRPAAEGMPRNAFTVSRSDIMGVAVRVQAQEKGAIVR